MHELSESIAAAVNTRPKNMDFGRFKSGSEVAALSPELQVLRH